MSFHVSNILGISQAYDNAYCSSMTYFRYISCTFCHSQVYLIYILACLRHISALTQTPKCLLKGTEIFAAFLSTIFEIFKQSHLCDTTTEGGILCMIP